MKRIIIAGCNGQLGKAMNKEMMNDSSFELLNFSHMQFDITNIDEVMKSVREIKPYAVINCAAHTKVDDCESHRDSAYQINAVGPRNLAVASNEAGFKLVHISTDYVFDGKTEKPYMEFDKTNPQSVYASSKLAGENFIKEFGSRYFILRTAGLYGEGKNFVRTMLELSKNQTVIKVVSDQKATPTSAKELSRAIHYLINTENYGLFHATCEGECSWDDFAREIFKLSNIKANVVSISSREYPSKTNRPSYSVLENYMFRLTSDYRFKSWQNALKEYLFELC